MKRDSGRFHFKRFSVAHNRSSIKVGVDGVLVGLWSEPDDSVRILDIGTGCGVIALIAAQLTEKDNERERTIIDAIDIDRKSIEEASENFKDSPWSDRLNAIHCGIADWKRGEKNIYDLIISNPPFFNSGIGKAETPRLAARHQESLPLMQLMESASRLLKPGGRICIIYPSEFATYAEEYAKRYGMIKSRASRVRGHENAPWKRKLLEFTKLPTTATLYQDNSSRTVDNFICNEQSLTLETTSGHPTDAYRELGRDFYLKF